MTKIVSEQNNKKETNNQETFLRDLLGECAFTQTPLRMRHGGTAPVVSDTTQKVIATAIVREGEIRIRPFTKTQEKSERKIEGK